MMPCDAHTPFLINPYVVLRANFFFSRVVSKSRVILGPEPMVESGNPLQQDAADVCAGQGLVL